uniref:Uncharacterized protein n=1 Tax=Oryza meridionalis TaxID=40149 RepID=A0A0E0BXV1_9ORYZ
MATLQRSSQTFRRSGSSGLVWDERLMLDGHSERDQEDGALELRHSRSVGSIGLQRRHGDGAGHTRCNNSQAFHTRRVPPAQDPPSPKVPGCIFCGIFRKLVLSEPSKPRRLFSDQIVFSF